MAFRAAGDIAVSLRKEGLDIQQANHIHIKSILGRLTFLRRGRNTLSYMGEADGFTIIAGDPGGITDAMGEGDVHDYVKLATAMAAVIRAKTVCFS